MGAGNKLDPTKFQVADIYKTSVDPLARVMRRELKKRHVKHLKVVYSTEEARKPVASPEQGMEMTEIGHPVPGSVAFVPSVCGLIIGGEVVKDLTKEERERLEQN
jgi:tRNA A37 threonylcarbamoyladenosine dehydratase